MTRSGGAVLAITRQHESAAANTFRTTGTPPVFTAGKGAWLHTATGERWLDLVCGSATSNLGHGHPAHRAAVERALDTGIVHTGTRLPSPFRADLYERLASILPARLDCFQLANSGAEAVEAALKAAQYATGRRRLLSFAGGYHGRTLGALSVTHGARIRAPFTTLDRIVDFLPYPHASDPVGPVHDADACLAVLDARLAELAQADDLPAGLIVEPIQGTGGVIVPPRAFMTGLRARCRAHGVILIADEIWSGFGRCGKWFSFHHSGIEPDLVVMGKALSGGLPLSAVAGPSDILKAWPPGMHTSTFQGNPLACAMAVATIDTIRTDGLPDRAATTIEPLMHRKLAPLGRLRQVHAIRVNGAQAAIEFVDAGGAPDADRIARLQRRCLHERLLVYAGGWHGNALMLLPPLVIDEADLGAALDRIVALVGDVCGADAEGPDRPRQPPPAGFDGSSGRW